MARPTYSFPDSARVTRLKTPSRIAVYLAALAAILYFPWRLTTFNPDALLLSVALYAAELFGLVTIALHFFMTWRLLDRQSQPPLPDAMVDIFIPTFNEPVDMLRRTCLAARNMKYPHDTWLLDDKNRPEMATLAAELGIHYLARTDNKHAKAGNLNNALKHSSGEFIAIFDADHVPHENFIVRTLGYFADSNVAFVQTPQDFYILDSFQHRRRSGTNVVWSEQSLFFRVIMLGKDYWNAAFFCGSCAMARRSAIEAIGGFATETITEDLHTSIRLHKKGFGSVYHAESLAYGIAPDTFEPYESQRVRWGQGAMQVWRLERIATARNLTLAQRICYLASILTYFDGWQKGFMFLLPSFVLITGIVPVASLDWSFAARFLPWFVLSMLVTEELGRGYARSWTIEQYNFLRSPGFAFATLTLFLNRKLRFRVTKKSGGLAIENVRRLAPHFAVIAVALLSPIAGAARYMLSPYMTVSALALNVLWCILTLVVAISAVRFAFRHSKQERGSYRFRLPIPVRIRDRRGHTHIFPVEDISSGGFSAFIPENLAVEAGAAPDADLILPSGVLHVGLNVLRVWTLSGSEGQPRRVLAVQFAWRTRNDEDCLDLYLYGSNAEWRFSGLTEQENTPVAWLTARLKSLRRGSAKVRQDWRTALVVPTDCTRSIEVLTSTEKGAPAVSTFLAEVPIRIGDALTLISPQGGNHIGYYRVESLRRFDGRGRMMFQHRLSKLDALPQTGSSHAVSRWWGQAELTAA